MDIRKNKYVSIYDADARVLRCVIVRRLLGKRVKLEVDPREEANPGQLRHILRDFLTRKGTYLQEQLSLDELLIQMLLHFFPLAVPSQRR